MLSKTDKSAEQFLGKGRSATVYAGIDTEGRLVTIVRSVPKPWIALIAGMAPIIGNAAFPLQLIYESREKQSSLAKFILYDVFARLGEAVPIWGGEGTLTEHWLNHVGDFFVSKRSPLYEDSFTPDKRWTREADAVGRITSQ